MNKKVEDKDKSKEIVKSTKKSSYSNILFLDEDKVNENTDLSELKHNFIVQCLEAERNERERLHSALRKLRSQKKQLKADLEKKSAYLESKFKRASLH